MNSDLAITDRMILCHGLIQLEQTVNLMLWCDVQSSEMPKFEKQLKRLKKELLENSEIDKMYKGLSTEYTQFR
jgi:predicted transglutaminase-like protease